MDSKVSINLTIFLPIFFLSCYEANLNIDEDMIQQNEDIFIALDSDGDGVPDSEDQFPNDASEYLDTDGDGLGNNADEDDDGDGYLDTVDAFPLNLSEWFDTDSDGIGNNSDDDDDGDGISDAEDAFPLFSEVSKPFRVSGSKSKDASGNITSYSEIVYSGSETLTITYNGPGVDTIWGNSDDDVASYIKKTSSLNGDMVQLNYNGPGGDGDWHTPDDTISAMYERFEKSEHGFGFWIWYKDAGADLDWSTTSDNGVFGAYKNEYNSFGRVEKQTKFVSKGADSTWATPDDTIDWISVDYELSGNELTRWFRDDPGSDLIWETSDDTLRSISKATLDQNQNTLISHMYNGSGTDTLWGTSDDVLQLSDYYEYDENGNNTDRIRYNSGGLGPDGELHSSDDTPAFYWQFIYDKYGNLIETRNNQAGVDGLWFTSDDTYTATITDFEEEP